MLRAVLPDDRGSSPTVSARPDKGGLAIPREFLIIQLISIIGFAIFIPDLGLAG